MHGLDFKNGHKNLLTSSPNQPWQREENAQKSYLKIPWISLSTNSQNGWFFLALDHTFIQPLLLAKTRNFSWIFSTPKHSARWEREGENFEQIPPLNSQETEGF